MSKFTDSLFHPLQVDSNIELPKKFTFPFYYEPHELSIRASKDLQAYLMDAKFEHNFGLDSSTNGMVIGKMFGVMVVKNSNGDLGYLAAFSGKLAESNTHDGFVPTVYDTLNPAGFYKIGEQELNDFNREIEAIETSEAYKLAKINYHACVNEYNEALQVLKQTIKEKKVERKEIRASQVDNLSPDAYKDLLEELKKQSIYYHFRLKDLKNEWKLKIESAESEFKKLDVTLNALKEKRKLQSAALQKQLHEQYAFLNAEGNTKDLLDIFENTTVRTPPAGAGECAAPKLFQYAYEHQLKPIAMAEFWWGASPKSQVRKHKHYYPACRSKCEPILGHMMKGLNVEANPILEVKTYNRPLEILYEDDYLLLVNKPHEFLSVPGKTHLDSVQTKMQQYLPNNKPLLVHRLDMSTSGILLVAKNEKTHKNLQKQFIKRTIKKRYVAVLEGALSLEEGFIDLPLRVDLDNRPQQLVCYEHGKTATTRFEVVEIKDGKTRIHFYPITGRTHQLRVHAAHANGLKTPIVGDDLYGTKADRLHLHAEMLEFEHPVKKQQLKIVCKAPF